VLLAAFALPTVLTSTWRPAVERAAHERAAPFSRLARHLFTTATTATPGKEVRVTRLGQRLATERRAAWERWYGPVSGAPWGSAAALRRSADLPVPARLTHGIRFEHVSFAYPGTERLVLDDVNLELPAGAVVALVGENGAGKTTLVKLLAKLYEPNAGRILIDDVELARMPPDLWRARLAGAFQDFFRFEFQARHTVGIGDVPRLDDEPAVVTAVGRAGAADVVAL